eukprot:752482-Hanusia_phi.AAC.2
MWRGPRHCDLKWTCLILPSMTDWQNVGNDEATGEAGFPAAPSFLLPFLLFAPFLHSCLSSVPLTCSAQAFYSRLALVSKLTNLFGKKKHVFQVQHDMVEQVSTSSACADLRTVARSEETTSCDPVRSHALGKEAANSYLQHSQRLS